MKKLTVIFAALIVFSVSTFAQNRSISFETGTWSEILAKAKKENKMIFMDGYTSWCGPCKWLEKNVFTNDTVADYYNQNFICAHFDMEKGEGPALAKIYDVKCYPNLLFIDGSGDLIHRAAGAWPVNKFMEMGNDAQNPEKQFAAKKKKYERNKHDPVIVEEYIKTISPLYLDQNAVLTEYFKSVHDYALTTPKNWNLIKKYTNDIDSREFKYVVKNREKFTTLHTVDSVDDKIYNIYVRRAYDILYRKDSSDTKAYPALQAAVAELKFSKKEQLQDFMEMVLLQKNKDWEKYYPMVLNFSEKYDLNNQRALNETAWRIYENKNDMQSLEQALKLAQRSVSLDRNYFNVDTESGLLEKLGRYEEALQKEEEALELAKKLNFEQFIKNAEKRIQGIQEKMKK